MDADTVAIGQIISEDELAAISGQDLSSTKTVVTNEQLSGIDRGVGIGEIISDDELKQLIKFNNPEEEKAFQDWHLGWSRKTGVNPDPDDSRHYYDYRAAYKAGAEPKLSEKDNTYHWPSKFKSMNHPNRFVDGIDIISGKEMPIGTILSDEQLQNLSQDSAEKPGSWITDFGKNILKGTSRIAGIALGATNSPLAFVWGSQAEQYKNPEEFDKLPFWKQALVATGARGHGRWA